MARPLTVTDPIRLPLRRPPGAKVVVDCNQCGLLDLDLRDALRLADELRATAQQIESCLRPQLEAFGLDTKAYLLLTCLADAGGTMLLRDLARQVGLERAQQTRCLDGLATRGWLRRVRNPQDRRSATIELLLPGRQLVQDMDARARGCLVPAFQFPLPSTRVCLMRRGTGD